jgi:hypothetical protein
MRRRPARLFVLLAAALALPAAAALPTPADELVGTWECRVPGAAPTKTPPIVWFGPAEADGRMIATHVDLDGFARSVSGVSDIVPDANGWWKVQPQDGPSFLVQPLAPRGKTPAMTLRRGGASYSCLRLPRYI